MISMGTMGFDTISINGKEFYTVSTSIIKFDAISINFFLFLFFLFFFYVCDARDRASTARDIFLYVLVRPDMGRGVYSCHAWP